jgi:hypothetical protein
VKDARKDWQKKAVAYRWDKSGTVTSETEAALSKSDYEPTVADYAKALGISEDQAKARIARQRAEKS